MNKLKKCCVRNRRHIVIISCMILAIILASFYLWQRKISVDLNRVHFQSFNGTQELTVGDIHASASMSQDFSFAGEFKGISIRFDKNNASDVGFVDVSVYDTSHDVLVHRETISSEDVVAGLYHEINFQQAYGFDTDTKYNVVVSSELISPDNAISIWCSNSDVYPGGSLYIAGTKTDGDMNFGVITSGIHEITIAYLVVISILGISLVMLYLIVYVFRAKVHVVFLAVAIPFGLVYSLIMSPGVVPDELAHMDMAYRYSNQIMGINNAHDPAIFYRLTDVENWIVTSQPGAEHYQKLLDTPVWATEGTENKALIAAKTANAHALLYAPSAIGVTFARIIHLGTIPMFYLGRMCNFIIFLLGVYFAIKITPVGKNIFFASALLPMTMHQAFSFSYDSVMTGGLFFLIALFLRAIYGQECFRLRDKLIIMLLCTIFLPGKAIYIFVAAVAFLIPSNKFGGMRQKITFLGGLFLVTGIAYMFVNLNSIATLTTGALPPQHVDRAYDFAYLLEHPFQTVKIFAITLVHNSSYYVKTLVGERLGWLEIYIPTVLVLFSIVITGVAFLHDTWDKLLLRSGMVWHRVVYVSIFALVVLAAMFTMMIAYTRFGSEIIDGVQGRYFIPILPLLGLVVYCRYIKIDKGILKHLYMAEGVLHFAVLFFLI